MMKRSREEGSKGDRESVCVWAGTRARVNECMSDTRRQNKHQTGKSTQYCQKRNTNSMHLAKQFESYP